MKENKTVLIVLGCVGFVCLCLAVAFTVIGGLYLYEKVVETEAVTLPAQVATVPPVMPATEQPQGGSLDKPTLDDLARVSVLPATYSSSANGEAEGIAIDLVYFDRNDEVITFDGVPLDITVELFAFRDFLSSSDLSAGDNIYADTVTIDHSSTLEEMFDNYIRIPYADFDVDPNEYVRFGAVRVTVDAPSGSFEAISTFVILYPEEE